MPAPQEQPASEYRYWAFISYSHADEKWADWLHKALETYTVPKVLMGKPSQHGDGTVPKRAYPVFRDRDELASSADLGERLTSALRQSRYLIVVCSPRAVKSKWVNEEIKTFKSMGRENRVLCLIVDGEPYASENPHLGLEECFPEPVRYRVDASMRLTSERTEPIAADARPGKDGKENARLKLLAGMFGVNFSDLRQRDQERQKRRYQMILTGVTVLLFIFLILGVELYRQRNDAVAARNDAVYQRDLADAARAKAVEAQKAEEVQRIIAEQAQKDEAKQREAAEQAKAEEEIAKNDAVKQKDIAVAARDEATRQRVEAERQKAIAEQAQKEEAIARQLAEERERQVARALSISYFNEANQLIADKNEATALAFLAKALRFDSGNSAVQARLVSLLTGRNWPLPELLPLPHEGPVSFATFSPDGQSVLTISGNRVHLWDARGKALAKPLVHAAKIHTAEFSPDGSRVVTASDDKTAQVWDAVTGERIGPALAHKDWVYSARFSLDGQRIVTASHDRTVGVWNAATGEAVTPPLAHDNSVRSAHFSPDGTRIVTASVLLIPDPNLITSRIEVNAARLWAIPAGTPVGEPMAHEGGVDAAIFSPDGKYVATASGDKTARIWDATTGRPVSPPLPHAEWVNTVYFTPDGKFLVTTSSDRTARLWEVPSGNPAGEPLQHDLAVNDAAASPNAKWIVTSSEDRTVRVFEADTGRPFAEPIKLEGATRSPKFSPDGSRIVIASGDRTAQIWTPISGKPLVEPLPHEQLVTATSFSPDGKYLVTASGDRKARIWEVSTGKLFAGPFEHQRTILAASFSADGRYLATGSEDGTARIWDIASGKGSEVLRHSGWVTSATFSPDGKWLLTASEDRTARLWEVPGGRALWPKPVQHNRAIKSAMFSPDGKQILTASQDRTARIWDAATGAPIGEPFTHESDLRHATFSHDGKWVATAAEDRTARVWSVATGKPVTTEPLRHEAAVNYVSFSPSGKWLVSASDDKTARIWDVESGRPAAEPLRHEDVVRSATFNAEGTMVITVSREKVARVWETESWKLVCEPLQHDGVIRAASFSPDSSFIATASEDKTARLWQISLPGNAPDWFADLAEAIGGYRLGEAGGAELISNPWGQLEELRGLLARIRTADGFDLALVSVASPGEIPVTGTNLVLVANTERGLHFRIFDAAGQPVVNTAEAHISLGRAASLAELKTKLAPHWNQPRELAPAEKRELLDRITLIGDPFGDWTRWYLADRSTRAISSYAPLTVPEYISRRVGEGSPEALNDVLKLKPDHALALAKLGRVVAARDLDQADFYTGLAAKYEPDNYEVLWMRGDVLQKRNQFEPAYQIMEKAIALDPQNIKSFGPEGQEISVSNGAGYAAHGWLPNGWLDQNPPLPLQVNYARLKDPPVGNMTAIQVTVTGKVRGDVQLKGPRFIGRQQRKYIVEGWVRSERRSDFSVAVRQFLEPYEKFGETLVRTTPEWKRFQLRIDAKRDFAAEIMLSFRTDAVVDLADVIVRPE